MTSLLTFIDTTLSQSNSQQHPMEDISLHIPKLNDNLKLAFSNQAKPSSLLAKRLEVSDLGDLITKRVKTQSTNVSDNGSIQHSPTSKKNLLMNEKDNNSADDTSSTTFTRCSSSESANGLPCQDSFSGSPVVIEIDAQSFPEESGAQLQQALVLLREKMIEQEAQNLLEMFFISQLCQEPLYIPPLMESPSDLVKPSADKVKKQVSKKNIRKMELDQEFSYGTVEYPFLSISTPFPEDGDLSSLQFGEISNTVDDSYASLTCKDPYLDEKVAVAFAAVEKKGKKTEIKRSLTVRSPGQESQSSTKSASDKKKQVQAKDERKVSTKKVLISKVMEKVQKKSKENEKEVGSPKTMKQEKEDDLYSRPVISGRRFTQRTKNRWQIAQDEKVKDIVLPALNFDGGYELFFDNKKKPVPIGDEYQVDVSIVTLQSGKPSRRMKPQMKWDPSSHCENELKKFFGKVKSMVNGDYNEEKAVGVILENKNDVKRALKYITANKSKCLDTLRC